MIYIQITSKQCSAIQPSEEMHENQWQGNNIRSRMLENAGTWIVYMTFTAKLRQLEPSHTSRHGRVHFYAAVPSTGGSEPKMQKKTLEFGIFRFLYHFLPFQNGFEGREGFTNDPEPYGSIHPVLIWAHLEPYGPISNQSLWCSSKNIWTQVLDQDLGLGPGPDQVLDPLDLVQDQVPDLVQVPDLDPVMELIFGTPWTWSSNGTESTHINWHNSNLVCISMPMCTFNGAKT